MPLNSVIALANVLYSSFQHARRSTAIEARTVKRMSTYVRFRFTDFYNEEVMELDGIHIRTKEWKALIAGEPSFADWRVAHLPNGWTVAIEPIGTVATRILDSVRPNASGSASAP